MMTNSDVIAAVGADRRRDFERAAARYRLGRLARPSRRSRSSGQVTGAADQVSLPGPAADRVRVAGPAPRHAEQQAEHRPSRAA